MKKTTRKYTLNENVLQTVDTQEKAYVLGLLYADGYNNTDRKAVTLALNKMDLPLLEEVRSFFSSNKPFGVSKDLLIMNICSPIISSNLVSLGCTKAKTHTISFPSYKQVPEKFQNHFIRGYFDGDGSISGFRSPQFSIVSNEDFLLEMQKIMIDKCKLSATKLYQRHKNRSNKIKTLCYTGVFNCKKIYDYMYENSTIHLKRKKEKFEDLFKKKKI